jgi:hypothetical protein
MDSHIAELSENLCKLTSLLQQGKNLRPFYYLSHIYIFTVHQFRRVSKWTQGAAKAKIASYEPRMTFIVSHI